GLSARGARVSAGVSALGLAAAVLHRWAAGAARAVRARARPGVRGVARDATRDVVASGARDRRPLEALPLYCRADGDDEHGQPRHAGHVSDLSRARLAPRPPTPRRETSDTCPAC